MCISFKVGTGDTSETSGEQAKPGAGEEGKGESSEQQDTQG